jgi:hypothetical protein
VGLPANIVEEYIPLGVLLHVRAALMCSCDISIGRFRPREAKALTSLRRPDLLAFMTIHLFQSRGGDTDQFGP